jgi:hypothetical protein
MASCPTCAGRLEEAQRVCHACGSLRPDTLPTREDERAVLVELRQAMAAAIGEAERQSQPVNPVRDRFLRNALVPADPELLVEEAVYCQTFFLDAIEADTTVPQARFRALLTRLEVLAVDDPSLGAKAAILAGQLAQHRRVALRNSLLMAGLVAVAILAFLGAIFGVLWALARLF